MENKGTVMDYNCKKIIKSIFSLLLVCLSGVVFAQNLTTVKVGLLEGFTPLNTMATSRYRSIYESAIYYGLGETEQKLNQCGYKLELVPDYFNPDDLLSVKESAERLNKEKIWFAVSPIKSHHYLMAAQALEETPMLSFMASSDEIVNMPAPFFTMSPGIRRLTQATVELAENYDYGQRYGMFIDSLCAECKEFETYFDEATNSKFDKAFSLKMTGLRPDLDALRDAIQQSGIDFLVLPNDSHPTGHVISHLQTEFPELKYIGGEKWGQTVWSFLRGYDLQENVDAFSVRVGHATEIMHEKLGLHSLNISHEGKKMPPSHLAFGMVELTRKLADALCDSQAKNKADFFEFMSQQPKERFVSKIGLGVYKLKQGEIDYFDAVNLHG